MEERRLLITGATGFVGTHLIAYCKTHFPTWKLFFLVRKGQNITISPTEAAVQMEDLPQFLENYPTTDIVHLAGKAHDTSKTQESASYFEANYDLTKELFDVFLRSSAHSFVFVSSIKSIHNNSTVVKDESHRETLVTPYAQSKRMAEDYLFSQPIPAGKRFFVLRPALVYGYGVKGNLRSLVKFVNSGFPYPFSAFHNQRSYLSVSNLCFTIKELLNSKLPSDVFNVADDEPLGTAEIVKIIGKKVGRNVIMLPLPVFFWKSLAKTGDFFHLPFNSEVLSKLTDSMVVSNHHLLTVLQKPLPEKSHSAIANIV